MTRISGWRAGLTACALIVATSACDATGPAGVRARVTYTWERAVEDEAQLPDTAGILVTVRRVDIHGLITGDNCRVLVIEGEPAVEGDRIVITMTMRPAWSGGNRDNMGCAVSPGRYDYVARISGISAGAWTVEVRHRFDPQGVPATVATETVVIP